MKNLISFITFLIFFHCITAEAKERSQDPVLDVDGNKLVEGHFYAFTSLFYPGAGVSYYELLPNQNCTYGSVYQQVHGEGLPVTFRLPNSQQEKEGTTIDESTDLYIEFFTMYVPGCPSAVWKVSKSDDEESTELVMTGEAAGSSGTENPNIVFQIRKAGDNYYKLVNCARRNSLARSGEECRDVGLDGPRRLVLNGENTYHVMFRRYIQLEHEMY